MDFKTKMGSAGEALQGKWDQARTYVEEHPEKVRTAAPFAAIILFILLGTMIVRVSREVPQPPIVADRGHPLETFAEPVDNAPQFQDPVAASEPAPQPELEPESESEPAYTPPRREAIRPAAAPAAEPVPDRPAAWDDGQNDEDRAGKVVETFFSSLNSRDYGTAYRQLSTPWQDSIRYENFANGYLLTDSIDCRVEHARDFGDGRVRVAVTLDTVENGRAAQYVGTMMLVREGVEWRIDRGLQLRI